jgi:hypothetical protein
MVSYGYRVYWGSCVEFPLVLNPSRKVPSDVHTLDKLNPFIGIYEVMMMMAYGCPRLTWQQHSFMDIFEQTLGSRQVCN